MGCLLVEGFLVDVVRYVCISRQFAIAWTYSLEFSNDARTAMIVDVVVAAAVIEDMLEVAEGC